MGRSSKDKRDIFYRLAKEEGWRARSAFKLLQINEQFNILGAGVVRAVDLCAAPGSWSQVLAQTLKGKEGAHIVAVDLQAMAPIPGVQIIQGDITAEATAAQIINLLGNSKADIVVCDGAPDVTGLHHLDEYLQSQLLLSALNISTAVLSPGGTFVAKMFRSSKGGVEALFSRVSLFFNGDVVVAKPRSSRASSIESFIVARGFNLPFGYTPSLSSSLNLSSLNNTPQQRLLIPFITCGDLRGWDGDTTYPLPKGYEWKDPVQSPIAPAYAEAVRRKRGHGGGSGGDDAGCDSIEASITAIVTTSGVNNNSGGNDDKNMEIDLSFGGGAELLVGGWKEKRVVVPRDSSMGDLLEWMIGAEGVVKDRPELIVMGKDVRPGILVLINDTDWELCDKIQYILQPNDVITFISTLHGG